MVLARSGWMMWPVLGLRPDSLTVIIMALESTTASIVKMLESHVELHALKETSDCKEALPTVDVWRSATITSGAQCVMIFLVPVKQWWCADSWDSPTKVSLVSIRD